MNLFKTIEGKFSWTMLWNLLLPLVAVLADLVVQYSDQIMDWARSIGPEGTIKTILFVFAADKFINIALRYKTRAPMQSMSKPSGFGRIGGLVSVLIISLIILVVSIAGCGSSLAYPTACNIENVEGEYQRVCTCDKGMSFKVKQLKPDLWKTTRFCNDEPYPESVLTPVCPTAFAACATPPGAPGPYTLPQPDGTPVYVYPLGVQ